MTSKIYPCLWFDGRAKEAAEFYCSVFDNSRITADTPMVVTFEIFGKKIMGLNGGPAFKINPSISLFVLLESIEATNAAWNKLAEGGTVLMPIDKYFWSERYGWIQDRYGMTWQVSVVNKTGDPQSLTPSLLFTADGFGRAEEAVRYYCGVFADSSVDVMMHYPEGEVNAGKVLFSECRLNGYNLIAMDGPGVHEYSFNEAVSLVVDCRDQEEVDFFWNNLIDGGGQESMCGWLKDRFGVSWQIVPAALGKLINDPDQERAGRAVQAMLKMKKLVIADLEKAAAGNNVAV
jgi:predicted 3-demethylubiquinone-9 3-methyltransferase (glyoxalase superfamily)